MATEARELEGDGHHPIPIKKLVSNKQPSLFSSTRKIQKSKKGNAHASMQCEPIFVIFIMLKKCPNNKLYRRLPCPVFITFASISSVLTRQLVNESCLS